jgi:hypothetical protein
MPTDESAKELRELSDREAIRDCLMRYCHGVDRCDEPMIRDVYWPEATDEHGMLSGKGLARYRTRCRSVSSPSP